MTITWRPCPRCFWNCTNRKNSLCGVGPCNFKTWWHNLFQTPFFASFHDFRSIFRAWRLWGGGPVIILTALPKPGGPISRNLYIRFPCVTLYSPRIWRGIQCGAAVRVNCLFSGAFRSCQFLAARSFVSISCGVVVRVNFLCRWASFVRV